MAFSVAAFPLVAFPLAVFRRVLVGESGVGLDGVLLGQLASAFWPLLLGGALLVILLAKGEARGVIPLAGGAALLQAWQSGAFG